MTDRWKLIGNLIKRKTKGQIQPNRLVKNNQVLTKPQDIANAFNHHFVNAGPSLSNVTPDYMQILPITLRTHHCQVSLCPSFSELKTNKVSLDIPNNIIKIACEPLSIPFTFIYNKCITSVIVPDNFKISRVTPIYENGAITDPNNFRPISTLSPFSKVMERIVYDQANLFLGKNDVIFSYQFGFRKGYSTEITDNLKTAVDRKRLKCGIFQDFSKAFDTVNHEILLSKLNKYGFPGVPLLWFTDYLINRKQYVKLEDVESDKMDILCGVPQGSTLGPLFFLICINDMPNSSKKTLSEFLLTIQMYFTRVIMPMSLKP